MKENIRELARFTVTDESGVKFLVIESSVLPPVNFNSRGGRVGKELERKFSLANGTPLSRLSWNRFQCGQTILMRSLQS